MNLHVTKANAWWFTLTGSIESFPDDQPSLSPLVPVQIPSALTPIIPLTCITGTPKGFKQLQGKYLMCAKYYHY